MQIQTNLYSNKTWEKELDYSLDSKNTLITIFGSVDYQENSDGFSDIFQGFPNSIIIGCSTSGEIYENELYEDSLSIAITKFEKTTLKLHSVQLDNTYNSFKAGKKIAEVLQKDSLKSIFILSDSIKVNGSQLTSGLNSILDKKIIVTGGMAGDNANFEKTWVLINNGYYSQAITAVGFYGEHIHCNYGAKGGWQKFGIDHIVTKSDANILYELDHKPALDIYKNYLGELAKDLPSSALLFPLMIKNKEETKVRSVVGIDHEKNSITFAGDIPQDSQVALMRTTNFDILVDAAEDIAEHISMQHDHTKPALNIAISCIGRKLVLKQRTEDEIEVVKDTFCNSVSQIGFYSHGELSPLQSGMCDLHNQTMTLTLLWES